MRAAWSARVGLTIATVIGLGCGQAWAGPPAAKAERALTALSQASGAPLGVRRSARTGLATFISTDVARPIRVPVVGPVTAEHAARALLSSAGEAIGLATPGDAALTAVSGVDEAGLVHVRFQQTHRGVPVRGGEIAVHLRGASATAVNARTLPDLDVDTTPTIGADTALQVVGALVVDELLATDATFGVPRLEILNPGFLGGDAGESRLVWFIEARGPSLREIVWVDAHTGAILLHVNGIADAFDRRIHTAGNTSAIPGTLIRGEGGPATGDADADAAYDFTGDVLGYFAGQHLRDSYDGAGAPVISTVHVCSNVCPYQNAFWNGAQLVFGEGFSQADDVVAHEFTHAVTERTANLFYCFQSGALNESFSDMFGESVDLQNLHGTDTPALRWSIGEDLPIGTIRSMADPPLFGDPGKVTDPSFICATSCFAGNDNGGVHRNSGVPNHAFALMAGGGTYNGHTVAAIGAFKAGKVAYRALTTYLTQLSDFNDADAAFRQSCADLVAGGLVGISGADCTQVAAALDAVEMGAAVCVPPVCGDGFAQGDEQCDDGNVVEGDGCDSNCTVTACGNGIMTAGEQCDDGNATPNDGCEGDCTVTPRCALVISSNVPRTIPDPGSVISTLTFPDVGSVGAMQVLHLRGVHTFMQDLEFHLMSPSANDVTIVDRACGSGDGFDLSLSDSASTDLACPPVDGQMHRPSHPLAGFEGEPSAGTWALRIDDVTPDDSGTLQGWGLLICRRACGNGTPDPGELCDDGNEADGDGCDSNCTPTGCGNGVTTAGEACDDGNGVSGDGCENDCTVTPTCPTVASSDVPRTMPAVGSATSALFSPLAGTIASVEVVGMRGAHTYVGDLTFHLIGPTGTDVALASHVCGAADDFDLGFSDAAASAVPCPPTDGAAHLPAGALAGFAGQNGAGVWTLRIEDTAGQDAGRLDAWGLRICTSGCAPGAPDADGDGRCDALDPCNSTGAQDFVTSKLTLVRIGTDTVVGNDQLKLGGSFALPVGTSFTDLAPDVRGARLVVETASGGLAADVRLPGGTYSGAGNRGWRLAPSGKKWTYLDRTGAPRNGVTKMSIKRADTATAPRRVKVDVKAIRAIVPVGTSDAPPRAIVVLGDDGDGAAGRCGETTFTGPDCRFSGTGNLLSCKE